MDKIILAIISIIVVKGYIRLYKLKNYERKENRRNKQALEYPERLQIRR